MSNLADRLHQAPFIRILIPFAAGIVLAEWIDPPKSLLYFLAPAFLLLFTLRKRRRWQEISTGLLFFGVLLFIGFSWSVQRRYDPVELKNLNRYAILEEYPKEGDNSFRAVIRLKDSGIRIIAAFQKSDPVKTALPGSVLYFKGKPELIKNRGNPFEFNYRDYSRRNGIGHRIYLKENSYYFLKTPRFKNIRFQALIWRQKLLHRLEEAGVKNPVFNVISAITFGDRDNLDPEITQSFTRTGTIHVLAVSGGNVAVIYFFLYVLFGFLNKRRSILAFTFVILSGIWTYTLLTGLSPSVLRAAIMFSFLVIGKNMNRNPDVYNSLASSAFVLLFLKPALLFDAGFQLSYAAVAAIVSLQPILYKLYYSKFWILDKGWMFFTVSIAAQAGTLPFSIWYFHQFPVYFWLTNIIVVPLVSLFLYLAILIMVISPFLPLLSSFLAHLLSWTGIRMLMFLHFAESLPTAVIENIYPSFMQMVLGGGMIGCAIFYFRCRKSKYWILTLTTLVIFVFWSTLLSMKAYSRREIVFFNSSGNMLMAFTKGTQTLWITDDKSPKSGIYSYIIKPYEGFRRIKQSAIFQVGTASVLKNEVIDIRDNFINFCGLKIFLLTGSYGDYTRIDFPETDLILAADLTPQLEFDLSQKKIAAIKITAPVAWVKNKAFTPKENSSGDQKALKISLIPKKSRKEKFRIESW